MERTILSIAIGTSALLHFHAANAVSSNFFTPILDVTVLVPCANNGAGELVDLNGNGHYTFTTTTTPTAISITTAYRWQLSGLGRLTGAKYQSSWGGQTKESFEGIEFPYHYTSIGTIRVTGQGPSDNFVMRTTIHKTVNADGTVTAYIDNYNVSCR
jgi:hypothetical protein